MVVFAAAMDVSEMVHAFDLITVIDAAVFGVMCSNVYYCFVQYVPGLTH